jgi:hypothetical protein
MHASERIEHDNGSATHLKERPLDCLTALELAGEMVLPCTRLIGDAFEAGDLQCRGHSPSELVRPGLIATVIASPGLGREEQGEHTCAAAASQQGYRPDMTAAPGSAAKRSDPPLDQHSLGSARSHRCHRPPAGTRSPRAAPSESWRTSHPRGRRPDPEAAWRSSDQSHARRPRARRRRSRQRRR